MNREPIGLYIFRYVMGMALLGLVGMLYWSSMLQEMQLRELRQDLREVLEETQRTREQMQQMLVSAKFAPSRAEVVQKVEKRSTYPNLLKEDVFYSKTLPSLLPTGFRPSGTLRFSQVGHPEHLHPFSNYAGVSTWIGQCNVSVAGMEFGKYETMAEDMAKRVELRDGEFWVFLRDGVYWQPLNPLHFPEDMDLASHFFKKHKVTAYDFKFYWDAIMNSSVSQPKAAALRNYLGDIEEFRVIDELTFVVRWKKEEGQMKYSAKGLTGSLSPLARWVYQYYPDGTKIVEDDSDPDTYRQDSVWAQNFSEHWARNVIVSCGPWLFDGITDERIRFVRNPDHFEPHAVLVEAMETSFRDSPDAVWQDFKSGKTHAYSLRPDQLIELDDFLSSAQYSAQSSEGLGVERLDYINRAYNYVGWNNATPWFSDKRVRRAMTMAIDRHRIVRQYLNDLGIVITGPFFRNSPSYDQSIDPWPYNPQRAAQLLEEAGWYDSDGDSVRDKEIDGERTPLRFGLTYYVKNPTSRSNCEYIATALKEIGVDCFLRGVDIADLSAAMDEREFDAIYMGWGLGTPPEEPKQLWHSKGAKEKGSSNFVGFANLRADSLIEQLQYEYDKKERIRMYHEFHRIVHDETPYTFLYTPKVAYLYRKSVQNLFIPSERQDLVPGANVAEPSLSVTWLKE